MTTALVAFSETVLISRYKRTVFLFSFKMSFLIASNTKVVYVQKKLLLSKIQLAKRAIKTGKNIENVIKKTSEVREMF